MSPTKPKDTRSLLPVASPELPQTQELRHAPASDSLSYAQEIHDQGIQGEQSPQVRPALARPYKKVAFNFSQKHTPELCSSPQPPTQQSHQSST